MMMQFFTKGCGICLYLCVVTHLAVGGATTEQEKAIFAGGCFWCIEAAFEYIEGVDEAVCGYTGGDKVNPTYEEVSAGNTGHYEAVEVTYYPGVVSYKKLLDVFWRNIDPLDASGQFVDRGSQYKTAIFYFNEDQKQQALASKQAVEKQLGQAARTLILPATVFYKAQESHQDYFKKNLFRYELYKSRSGREDRLEALWGKDKEISNP